MKTPKELLIAVAVLVTVAAISGYCVDQRFREWNERVEKVQEFAEAETARADSAAAVATKLAEELAIAAPEIRERIVRVREESPPDPARDSIIDDLVAESAGWQSAFFEQQRAYNRLRVVNDSLTNVIEDRPRPRSRWAPSLQAGVFAGICSDGKPCVGAGVGVTVEIKIPVRLPWDGS